MRKLSITLWMLAFGLFTIFHLSAENSFLNTNPTAKLMDTGAIKLDTNSPLSGTYEADANHYSAMAKDANSAQSMINELFDKDYVTLVLDYESMKITIVLDQTGPRSNWTVTDWNNHLKN